MTGFLDLSSLFKQYEDKWIALTEDYKVVGEGETLEEALNQAKRQGIEYPFLSKIPSSKYAYLLNGSLSLRS